MKTLVIANQKGGVGKTSTLVHLAFDYAERGLKVAVIDLDTQGNASFTLNAHQGDTVASDLFGGEPLDELAPVDGIAVVAADDRLANLEKLPIAEAGQAFRASIAALEAQGFDVCLIDTAPSLGNAMVSALLAADFIVSPIELETYSLQGIDKMVRVIANVRNANRKLQFLGMIPSKVDGRNPRHVQHLAELHAAYPKLMVPTPIGYRSSIADALASHRPVWTIRKTSARTAAREVRAMTSHILEKMEIA